MRSSPPDRSDMKHLLTKGAITLPPLTIRIDRRRRLPQELRGLFDGIIDVSWGGVTSEFHVRCLGGSTPRLIATTLALVRETLTRGVAPLLFAPYMSPEILDQIERSGCSGIDLCGNGVVIAPGLFSVHRTGGANRFTTSAPIKNVYRGTSSMIGRLLLVQPVFPTVQSVAAELQSRDLLARECNVTPVALSTVSKALAALAEDVLISRKGAIRLLQPETLLEKLAANYRMPTPARRLRGRLTGFSGSLTDALMLRVQNTRTCLCASGTASVHRYAVMARGDVLRVHCPDASLLLGDLAFDESDRFPNLEVIETTEQSLYFDTRSEDGFVWSSPIQSYLELMQGDKRDIETASHLCDYILKRLPHE